MVLNGMFQQERECWKTYLSGQAFVGFFIGPIEKARPAVAHNHEHTNHKATRSGKAKKVTTFLMLK